MSRFANVPVDLISSDASIQLDKSSLTDAWAVSRIPRTHATERDGKRGYDLQGGEMSRALTGDERDLIVRIAARLPDAERVRLLADIENASVETTNDDESIRVFEISGYTRRAQIGQHPYGVEGSLLDRDGTKVTILLHADENGRLFEMELIRWDEQPLVAPDWRTLELY